MRYLAKQFCVILSDRNNDWNSKINYSWYRSSIGAWSVTYESCEPYLTIHIHKPQYYKIFNEIIIHKKIPSSHFRLKTLVDLCNTILYWQENIMRPGCLNLMQFQVSILLQLWTGKLFHCNTNKYTTRHKL